MKLHLCWLHSFTRITYLSKRIGMMILSFRVCLRVSASAIQIDSKPICHSLSALMQLQLFWV
ncbi:MAG TPA: hypothetical protein DHV72_07180 [Serratia grimesii]|uniref:Uncharacterized protein n=1 Tax=Serratia grimesii TaxID=82995 RepID=A0A9C7QT17_9GAMM|nr:hypothetical protein [Serratia grimesii]